MAKLETSSAGADSARRSVWQSERRRSESGNGKRSPAGAHELRRRGGLASLGRLLHCGLRLTGLYGWGVRNAKDVRFRRLEISFDDLPRPFDGFQILHLSDLHVDRLREPTAAAARIVAGLEVDLCVFTGDFRGRMSGPYDDILPDMRDLFSRIDARHGILAVLGNHDSADMADGLEALGAAVLINESTTIRLGDSAVHIVGTDDVHFYYSDAARTALETAPEGFKIALIHSAEFADVAAQNGVRLYLAGHTHGGQVALPGGRPIVTRMTRHRAFASGLWRLGGMVGYTTTGVGVSMVPVRFNTRGEVVLITLRRA